MPEQNNTSDAKTPDSLYETQEMVGQEQFGSQLSAGRWKFILFSLRQFYKGLRLTKHMVILFKNISQEENSKFE